MQTFKRYLRAVSKDYKQGPVNQAQQARVPAQNPEPCQQPGAGQGYIQQQGWIYVLAVPSTLLAYSWKAICRICIAVEVSRTFNTWNNHKRHKSKGGGTEEAELLPSDRPGLEQPAAPAEMAASAPPAGLPLAQTAACASISAVHIGKFP